MRIINKSVVVDTNSYDTNCLSLTNKKIKKLEEDLRLYNVVLIEINTYSSIEYKKIGKSDLKIIIFIKDFKKMGVRKYNRIDMSKTLHRIKIKGIKKYFMNGEEI